MSRSMRIEPHMQASHRDEPLRGYEFAALEVGQVLVDERLLENSVFTGHGRGKPFAAQFFECGLVALLHRHMECEFRPLGFSAIALEHATQYEFVPASV